MSPSQSDSATCATYPQLGTQSLPKMAYRLALDLGTHSLGWAMLRLNAEDEPKAIIKAGVRIFSDGRNPKDGASLAVSRRQARGMRRRRDRLLQRKNKLIQALIVHGFFPADDEERKALQTLNPYLLRSEGLQRALSAAEFARALFHLNQRRGFLSNRRTDKKDSDASTMKNAIKDLRIRLNEENCQTLGQWLHLRHERKESVRARLHGSKPSDKSYDFYADRAMTESEFDCLWAKQAEFNPSLFNEVARGALKHILLFQRNLKPVTPGRCSLLPNEPRAALALPSTQQFRIYQELANLRCLDATLQESPLSKAQRDVLAQALERNTLSFSALRKALKFSSTQKFNLEDAKRVGLKGNATAMVLAKPEHFGPAWFALPLAKQDEIVSRLLEETDEAVLMAWLCALPGIDEVHAQKIANASLPDGYGNLSAAALARILPPLQASVQTYDKAVLEAGFDSHSALSHADGTGEIMASLPYYGVVLQRHVGFAKENPRNEEEQYGKIANPTVHIGLNQVRLLVNSLIKQYGHPREVVLEVARELKLSRERKQEIEREQAANQKRNDELVKEACKVLERDATHLDSNTRRDISQKMQLWQQLNFNDPLNRCCPYTGEQISIQRLLSEEVEIEHILPFSLTLDNGMMNKTVALTRANRIKGNRTPWQAFGERSVNGYDYSAILQRAEALPAAKRKRFAHDGLQQWLRDDKDFLARALTDTAYLSRIACEYLTCICPKAKVRAIPGQMTALIRGKLGVSKLLSSDGQKNREDHRHHALDAIVIGLTDKAMLQRFATASARAREGEMARLMAKLDDPWPTFRDHVSRALAAIYVSHKPEHGYQGAMHEDTAWGMLADGRARRSARPPEGGKRVQQIKNLALIKISDTSQVDRHGLDSEGNPKAYKGYVSGSNYCMEIWRDEKGRWQGDIVTTFDAYRIMRELGEEEGIKRLRHAKQTQLGKPLVMRICKKDYLRLEVNGTPHTMLVVKMGGNGQIFMAPHNESNVDKRNADKNDPFVYVSKTPGALQKAKGRQCTVTIDGQLHEHRIKG